MRQVAAGTKIVAAAATPERLVATSLNCQRIFLQARADSSGTPLNTKPVLVGAQGYETLRIMPNQLTPIPIYWENAYTLFVKSGANGEGVDYVIFR